MRRVVTVAVLGAVIMAIATWGRPAAWPSTSEAPPAPTVSRPGGASSWFCAAGATDGVTHQVIVANLGDRPLSAHLTGFGEAAVELPPVSVVDVGPRDRAVIDVAEALGASSSVAVELRGGAGLVEHRLATQSASDTSNCTTLAADRAYFAVVDTEKDERAGAPRPASARLWILNPFPSDASVDVQVATEETVRVPPALRGVVIPGGTVRSIELGEAALQRRNQGSVTVSASSGRVVAELAQTGDGLGAGEGLRLQPGVTRPSSGWVVADGFAGAGVTERYVVMNPSESSTVTVQLAVGVAGDDVFQPEPFVRDVEPRRYAVFDLHAESRLPESGLRWVSVTSSGGDVVVGRVVALDRAAADGTGPERPNVANGLAGSAGSSTLARRWAIASAGLDDGRQIVSIANPDPDAIAVVDLDVMAGGTRRSLGQKVEVPPGLSFAIDVTDALGATPGAIVVSASSPVAVALRATTASRVDLSVTAATPYADTVAR